MTSPNPITASRERIEQEVYERHPEHRPTTSGIKSPVVKTMMQLLLQHEATVREEMAQKIEALRETGDSAKRNWLSVDEVMEAIRRTPPIL